MELVNQRQEFNFWIIFRILRCFLWLLLIPVAFRISDYLYSFNYKFIGSLLALLSLPLSIYLVFITLRKDIRKLRMYYSKYIFDNTINDFYDSFNKNHPFLNNTTDVSKEFFWDYDGKIYGNLHHYIDKYVERTDVVALRMQKVISKQGMLRLLPLNLENVQSIRFYNNKLISFNYCKPFPLTDIISFEVVNNKTVKRGESDTFIQSKQAGNIHKNILFGHNISSSTQGRIKTDYSPDIVVNDYAVYLTVKDNVYSTIKIHVGNNQDLAQCIKSELLLRVPDLKLQ